MAKVTKDSLIHDVMRNRPDAAKVLAGYRMGCQSCSGGKIETLAWGAMMHGVDLQELVTNLAACQTKKPAAK